MKHFHWRMSKDTAEKFLNILSLLEFSEPETDEYEALKDELRSLPGHPADFAENDYMTWEIVTVTH